MESDFIFYVRLGKKLKVWLSQFVSTSDPRLNRSPTANPVLGILHLNDKIDNLDELPYFKEGLIHWSAPRNIFTVDTRSNMSRITVSSVLALHM